MSAVVRRALENMVIDVEKFGTVWYGMDRE